MPLMASNSADEKKTKKEIRAEQDQAVIETYANIAAARDQMHSLIPAVQQAEDILNQWFEATNPSGGTRATAKGQNPIYQATKKLRAKFTAMQFEMDRFEEVLKIEWAVEQNKSLEKRDVFLARKVVEMNKYSKQFKTEVKKHLRDARIRIPGFNDDEVWDDNTEVVAEEDDGDESGDEEDEYGDDTGDAEEDGNENQSTPQDKGKSKVDDKDAALPEEKAKKAKKRGKKKKPNRKSKKGKRK